MKEHTDQHLAVFNTFNAPDPHSYGVFKMLQDIFPAFAEKIFYRNHFLRNLILSGQNPMNILDWPICGACETLAPWSEPVIRHNKLVDTCTCMADGCGRVTLNPVTFRTWLRDELKKKAPPEVIDAIDVAVDLVAARMMQSAITLMENTIAAHSNENLQNMGLVGTDGQPIQTETPTVKKTLTDEKIDLEAEKRRISMEVNADVRPI